MSSSHIIININTIGVALTILLLLLLFLRAHYLVIVERHKKLLGKLHI